MYKILILLLIGIVRSVSAFGLQFSCNDDSNKVFPLNTLTEEGAWCWFADPRAIHYENIDRTINSTYIGYIDVHGNIKAIQTDHLNKRTNEVVIRSWFQPDDHNNPTFLVLPNEHIMIFYSRHTDEPCFYYRVSQKPGDITTLGEEKKLDTGHNTTYPSPFILSDDPEHIYLCWRGVGWHPTIARLTIPDDQDNVRFDWGPHQIVRSLKGAGGVRPYAKYTSNGKDKIYLAYTTTHPDNQPENWIYLNYFDIHTKALKDIRGNLLSVVGESQLHDVDITPAYKENHPFAVVDVTPIRNWIWELSLDENENPVMATVAVSHDKSSHDYYHIRWTGSKWQKTFLTNAGGHFHQSPDIEKCYSGGLALDKRNPQIVYGSVPVEGKKGTIYELIKFEVDDQGKLISEEQLTLDSPKNNIRPFVIHSKTDNPALVWMQGNYYDWIVSEQRPKGYPTAIKTNMIIPKEEIDLRKGLLLEENIIKLNADEKRTLKTPGCNSFTIVLQAIPDQDNYFGEIIQFAGCTYVIPPEEMPRPLLKVERKDYKSQNILGNSDIWKRKKRSTNGEWYPPEKLKQIHLAFTYEGNVLQIYINGLLDQWVSTNSLLLSGITLGGFSEQINNLSVYDRDLSQREIKELFNRNISASERKIDFNKDWKFRRGIISNADQPVFDDSKWRILNLPHDWSMEPAPQQREGITTGPFSKMTESGAGGSDTGQTLGGEGWYRKEFTINEQDRDKLFFLYFEGIYNQSEVWINGKKAYYNPYGYTSYKFDITPFCNPAGEPNVIAVKVVNAGENSRWYSGSGIYRNAWLIKTEKLHLDEWDTFVNGSELNGKEAIVKLSTTIHNKTDEDITTKINLKIISPSGKIAYDNLFERNTSKTTPFATSFSIKDPELWSVENPVLYNAEITVSGDSNKFDKINIPFGIRTIEASAEKGFLLNGKSIKLKGACIHHDNGLLGATAIDRAEERKVELLKANGFNSVRCAHNQVSEHFLNTCDRLGLLVIHETFDQWQEPKRRDDYHQFFDEWSEKDMIASVRRDRNHPSIIMWSIGNEIAQRADSIGGVIAKNLTQAILQYDTSRFTTIGANDFWDRRSIGFEWDKDIYRAFSNVDIAGYNYMWWKYESDHAAYPERIIYGSESYPKDAALNWNLVEKYPAVIGDFVWTGIDYLGEAGLGHSLELAEGEHNPQFLGWPWYNAWCGDIDLCGDKKPQSYYRDIVWREREITMAVRPPVAPGKREVVNGWGWTDEQLNWNWKDLENQPMRVNVYSRSPKVRLYLNNKLLDEKEINKENYTVTFEVPYHAGILRAVNIDKGKESAAVELKTTGKPAAVRLLADRERIKSGLNNLAFVKIEIVDEEGNIVPDADLQVKIECSGEGRIIASGNAAPDDMASFRSLTPKTFRGKAIAIIQPDEMAGAIELNVSAEGVKTGKITIFTTD